MDIRRVALVRYEEARGKGIGSGLLIDDRIVLTADHVADGAGHRVEVAGQACAVERTIRSKSADVDLALLVLAEPGLAAQPPLGRIGCALVDMTRVGQLDDCQAVGFPRWSKTSGRGSAHVSGVVPTGDGLLSRTGDGLHRGHLTLVCNRTPAMPPIPTGALIVTHPQSSSWAGMSGAAVVSGGLVIGVVRSHNVASGGNSLTVTPLAKIDTLPEPIRRLLWEALGVADPALLPVLPNAVAPERPRQLPRPVDTFTGRADEVKWLDERLAQGRRMACTVLAISGMGGIGKTALAVHWSHLNAGRFQDGQLFANLRGFDPRGEPANPKEILDGFLRALGLDADRIPVSLDAMAAAFRTELAGRSVLIVLDNAVDAAQLQPLIPAAPGCLVVVTSRHELGALEAPVLRLGGLPAMDAIRLLRQTAGAGRVDAEPDAADHLAELCGYHPLALRIAGVRVDRRRTPAAVKPLATLVTQLADEHDRLNMLRLPRDESMAVRAVLSWSYRDLLATAPESARVFRLLGLHPGPDLSRSAAANLAGTGSAETILVMDDLVSANLIEPDTSADGRYRMHDLLRLYARECALRDELAGERERAVRRCLRWYVCGAIAADRILAPDRPHRPDTVPFEPDTLPAPPPAFSRAAQALGWFESERVNLLAAAKAALDRGDYDVATDLPAAAVSFYLVRSHLADWVTSHEIAFHAARRSGKPAARLRTAYNLGLVLCTERRFAEANAWLAQALDIAQASDTRDELAEAKILMLQGSALQGLLRHSEALAMHLAATHRMRERGEHGLLADALNSLGYCLTEMRRPAEALPVLQEAVQVSRTWGQAAEVATSQYYLAVALIQTGRYGAAARCLTEALTVFEPGDTGVPQRAAETLMALARALHGLGSREEAVACAQRALALFRTVGDGYSEAVALAWLGDSAAGEGDGGTRRAYVDAALRVLENFSDPQAAALVASLQNLDGQPSA